MSANTETMYRRQLADVLPPTLRVSVQAPPYASRIEAKILGCSIGQYVVLSSSSGGRPGNGLSALTPRIGDVLVVRFLVDGIAYGFSSRVTHLIAHPETLIFLEYPESIEQASIRRDRRIASRLPCNLIYSSGERIPALLLDISEGGGKIVTRSIDEAYRAPGTAVKLEFTLPPPSNGVHEIAAKVVRTTQQQQSIVTGISFERRDGNLMESLASFLCLDEMAPGDDGAIPAGA